MPATPAPVKLTRTLHLTNPPMHGKDVAALQRLLTEKGFPTDTDGEFGPATAGRCVEAKRRLGYPKGEQLPIAGPRLVGLLTAHAPFPPPPVPAPRVRYVDQMRFALAHKQNWRYAQIRPIPHHMDAATRITTDCSGGVTLLAEVAKLPDPNGRRYDGLGFTGTILGNCRQIPRSLLLVGDLVVFGRYPGHHVGAVIEMHPDPLLWSHGRQGDPRTVSLSVEAASQASRGHGTVTYCRFIN